MGLSDYLFGTSEYSVEKEGNEWKKTDKSKPNLIQRLMGSLKNIFGDLSIKSGGGVGSTINPSPSPNPTSTPTPTITPTPTPWDVRKQLTPYEIRNLVDEYFPNEDEKNKQKLTNTFIGESGGRVGAYNINRAQNDNISGYITPETTKEWWVNKRQSFPSIDVGLTQLNTAEAMSEYLAQKGLTYWDLLHDPEKNMEVAADLYYGRIPYTAPGLGNWVAAKKLGLVD